MTLESKPLTSVLFSYTRGEATEASNCRVHLIASPCPRETVG